MYFWVKVTVNNRVLIGVPSVCLRAIHLPNPFCQFWFFFHFWRDSTSHLLRQIIELLWVSFLLVSCRPINDGGGRTRTVDTPGVGVVFCFVCLFCDRALDGGASSWKGSPNMKTCPPVLFFSFSGRRTFFSLNSHQKKIQIVLVINSFFFFHILSFLQILFKTKKTLNFTFVSPTPKKFTKKKLKKNLKT